MKQILQEISELVLLLNEYDFTAEQLQSKWLGNPPATEEEIARAQGMLQITLPENYVQFLKITNGFREISTVDPTFMPVSQIDYLINIDEDLVEIWTQHEELADVARGLQESIVIGGLGEEQYFLLVPPNDTHNAWRYWKFASWIPGESPYDDLTNYFSEVLIALKAEAAGLTEPKPKPVFDYSLRDQVFAQEWDNVYTIAAGFLLQNKSYPYFENVYDLLKLLLLSAGILNKYEDMLNLIDTAAKNEQYNNFEHVFARFKEAAISRAGNINDEPFTIRENKGSVLDQLEEQIRVNRPDLLRDKSIKEKASYQLYFLYNWGNAYAFIKVYEEHSHHLFFNDHFKAAVVYATLRQPDSARLALASYFEQAFSYRPLAPFLHPELLEVMDKEFSNSILQKFKQ